MPSSSAPWWRARMALAVAVALAAIGLTSGAFAALAPAAGADTSITAKPLIDDVWVTGRHATVLVTIKADRLINATLRVKTAEPEKSLASDFGILPTTVRPAGAVVVEQPVEVPAGSEKQFVAVMPAEIADINDLMSTQLPSLQLRVELVQGDTVLLRDSVTIRPQQDVEGVGVLPDLASKTKVPDRVDLSPDTQKAHLVTFPSDAGAGPLNAGTDALEQLATIIGTPDDLTAINRDDVQRTALVLWINRGGHLVVDADAGPFDGLPESWQPGKGGFAAAGAGDVRVSHGNAVAGKWNLALLPTKANDSNISGDPNELLSYLPGIPMQDGLGRDAGFRLPDLGALVIFLVIYVILVGPITFVILARANKRAWAWACVPVLAVLFTAMFSISGAKLRNTTEASHATLIDIGPTASTAYTSALVGSVTGGRTTVELGRGWSADQADSGGENAGKPPTLTVGPDGLEAQLHLEPGAFSTVRASGPAGYANAVEVESHVDASTVKGSVKNNLDVDLQQVVVMLGYSAVSAGNVPAHASRDFTLERPRQSMSFDDTHHLGLPELETWTTIDPEATAAWGTDCSQSTSSRCLNPLNVNSNRFDGGDMVCDNNGCRPRATTTVAPPPVDTASPINAAIWIDHLRRDHGTTRRFGTVTVAGWTDQLDAPIHLSGGQAIRRGRTAIVARGQVTANELSATTVRREVVRTGSSFNGVNGVNPGIIDDVSGPGSPTRGAAAGAAYRLLMPAAPEGSAISTGQVLIRLPETINAARVLTPDGWQDFVRQPFSSAKLEIPLPAGSIMSGVVIIQVDQRETTNNFGSSSSDWQIRVLRDGEREKLEKNLALWKEQQEAYNKANPNANNPNNPNFPTTTCTNGVCSTTTSSVVIGGGSGGGTTSGTVVIPPQPVPVTTTTVGP